MREEVSRSAEPSRDNKYHTETHHLWPPAVVATPPSNQRQQNTAEGKWGQTLTGGRRREATWPTHRRPAPGSIAWRPLCCNGERDPRLPCHPCWRGAERPRKTIDFSTQRECQVSILSTPTSMVRTRRTLAPAAMACERKVRFRNSLGDGLILQYLCTKGHLIKKILCERVVQYKVTMQRNEGPSLALRMC